jgi:hypothetical protein
VASETIFRQYPTHGALALEIERQGLTVPQIVTCAHVLCCPMGEDSRLILLSAVRRQPFRSPITEYSVQDWRRGRNRSKQLQSFAAGLQLMGLTPDEYLAGESVPASQLSFACWVAYTTRRPEVLADVADGLQQGYRCPLTVNKISDMINGHRLLPVRTRALLDSCLISMICGQAEKPLQHSLNLDINPAGQKLTNQVLNQ